MKGLLKNAIEYRRFNSGGPGGQHSNTTENAVEASLMPWAAAKLGISPVSATGTLKSQHASKKAAVKTLKRRIAAALAVKTARDRYAAGKGRVRNYHQPNNRVKDAGGDRSWDATVGKGDLGPCIDGLRVARGLGEA